MCCLCGRVEDFESVRGLTRIVLVWKIPSNIRRESGCSELANGMNNTGVDEQRSRGSVGLRGSCSFLQVNRRGAIDRLRD